jgi:hypothetical protein
MIEPGAGKRKGTIADLGKLVLSCEEVELRYFIVLMRYTASPKTNGTNIGLAFYRQPQKEWKSKVYSQHIGF